MFALSVTFQRITANQMHQGGFSFSSVPLYYSGWVAAGSLVRRSSCVCASELVSVLVSVFSEDPSLVRNPKLASLWYARQTSSSRWKRGNWPLFPPRGNHAEYLWSKPKRQESCRLAGSCCTAASSNLTPGFIESRVTGNHRLSLFLFFFLQRSKVETFNLKISRWRRRESIAFPFLFSFSFSPTPQLICFWTFSVPPQSNGMLKLVELYSSQEQTRAGLTVRHR